MALGLVVLVSSCLVDDEVFPTAVRSNRCCFKSAMIIDTSEGAEEIEKQNQEA